MKCLNWVKSIFNQMLKRMSNRKVVSSTPVDSGDLRFLARWHLCDPPLHTWGYKRLMYPMNSLCLLNDQALGSSPTCTSGGWTTTCQCLQGRLSFILKGPKAASGETLEASCCLPFLGLSCYHHGQPCKSLCLWHKIIAEPWWTWFWFCFN